MSFVAGAKRYSYSSLFRSGRKTDIDGIRPKKKTEPPTIPEVAVDSGFCILPHQTIALCNILYNQSAFGIMMRNNAQVRGRLCPGELQARLNSVRLSAIEGSSTTNKAELRSCNQLS